jgi:hypothetical protein
VSLIKQANKKPSFLKVFEKRVGVQGEGEKLLQKFSSLPPT